MTRLNAANNAQTKLTAAIAAGDTSFYVNDGTVLPAAPFVITVENEVMLVGAKAGNLCSSVTRGYEGTTAAAHDAETTVENRWTAGMYNELVHEGDIPQNKLDATADPTVNDDMGDGYSAGSLWVNVTGDTAFVCLDATAGAAIWEKISGLVAHINNNSLPHGATTTRTASRILGLDANGNAPVNGIAFPATQSASSDPNTLDDYEEGTWEASFSCGTSGTITINNSMKTGAYVKVGGMVTVTGIFGVTSVSSPLGTLHLNGLPFTCKSGTQFYVGVNILATGLGATVNAVMGRIAGGGNSIDIYSFAAGSMADMADKVSASTYLYICATYFV